MNRKVYNVEYNVTELNKMTDEKFLRNFLRKLYNEYVAYGHSCTYKGLSKRIVTEREGLDYSFVTMKGRKFELRYKDEVLLRGNLAEFEPSKAYSLMDRH